MSYTSEFRGLGSNQHFRVQSAALLPLNYPGIITPVRGEGFEPSHAASKAAGLPLANPRAVPRRSGCARQALPTSGTARPTKDSCSSGGRNRTCRLRFNRASPYHSAPHRCMCGLRQTVNASRPGAPCGNARPRDCSRVVPVRHPVRVGRFG